MQYRRSIGSVGLFLTAVGGIIGSGWLFGPLYAAKVAGPAAIFAWIIGGLLSMIIALTFAELGSAFPLAGGMVRFAHFSHGPLISFTTGWMVWISSMIVAPVETIAVIQYAANYFPQLVKTVGNTHVMTHQGIIGAALIMLLMCALNWQGARFFNRLSGAIVVLKLIVPIITIIVLVNLSFHPSNFHTAGGFAPYGWQTVFAALPLGGIIYSFIGYSPALQLAQEAKNPQRAIPLAIMGSLAFCMILYVALQIAFVGAMEPSSLSKGWSELSFAGDSGPFAGILAALGVAWLVVLIYGDAIISPFGTGFIYTTATARVNYGLSEIGFFPSIFKKLTKRGVPMWGILVNYIVGLFMFLPFPGWQSMVSFIISCFVISYIIGPISLIQLRHSHPDQPRPFRLPYAAAISYLAFYICNLLIFWTGWQTVSRLMIAMLIGFVVFIIHCCRTNIKTFFIQLQAAWWLVPYLAGIGIISYLGSFGGIKMIPFGIDFVIIALFTWVIFKFTTKNAMQWNETGVELV
jgi:amino acid transporter